MVRGDEVYFSDVTAHPFESGLVTVRTQRLSEFELHARAILGLPADTIMISPGAAEVIYAGNDAPGGAVRGSQSGDVLADALRAPESDVRVFARHGREARRPLGAAVSTGSDVTVARSRARDVSAALRRLW
jgi:phosphoribosylglycinamide formyltransferase 2